MFILESKVEREVVKWWEGRGGMQIKLNLMGRRGYPDRLFLKERGCPIFIEFKREGKEVRPLQNYMHNRLRKLGYEVYVCYESSTAKAILARP